MPAYASVSVSPGLTTLTRSGESSFASTFVAASMAAFIVVLTMAPATVRRATNPLVNVSVPPGAMFPQR
jgi:hypothetical protein